MTFPLSCFILKVYHKTDKMSIVIHNLKSAPFGHAFFESIQFDKLVLGGCFADQAETFPFKFGRDHQRDRLQSRRSFDELIIGSRQDNTAVCPSQTFIWINDHRFHDFPPCQQVAGVLAALPGTSCISVNAVFWSCFDKVAIWDELTTASPIIFCHSS